MSNEEKRPLLSHPPSSLSIDVGEGAVPPSPMSAEMNHSLKTLRKEIEKSDPDAAAWEKYGRKTLYGSLPFMAAFGMQKKETQMKKVISAVSMNTLAKLHLESQSGRDVNIIFLTLPFL